MGPSPRDTGQDTGLDIIEGDLPEDPDYPSDPRLPDTPDHGEARS